MDPSSVLNQGANLVFPEIKEVKTEVAANNLSQKGAGIEALSKDGALAPKRSLRQKFSDFRAIHGTAWKVIKYIVIPLVALAVLGVIGMLVAGHFAGGISNIPSWVQNTVIPTLNNTQISVAQGLTWIAAPIVGAVILLAIGVKFGPVAARKIKAGVKELCPDNPVTTVGTTKPGQPKKTGGCFPCITGSTRDDLPSGDPVDPSKAKVTVEEPSDESSE